MATASRKSPGKHGGLGAAPYASGVGPVSRNEDKRVKSEVISSQDSPTHGKKGRAPAVLDRWFDAQLGRMYADVASEPVPVEMLQLIAKLKKPRQPGS